MPPKKRSVSYYSSDSARSPSGVKSRLLFVFSIAIIVVLLLLLLLLIVATAILPRAMAMARRSERCNRMAKEKLKRLLEKKNIDVRVIRSGDPRARPWDMQVQDERGLFVDIALSGNLGMGESYMDGRWECDRIDVMYADIIARRLDEDSEAIVGYGKWRTWLYKMCGRAWNMQSKSRSWEVAERHYDLGNDLYTAMLDTRMVYSCAYWERAQDLDQAQEDKLELTCRKVSMHLHPGMRVLDIGCGWGSFMEYAAEKHDAYVVGMTVSKEQVEMGQSRQRKNALFAEKLEYHLQDYRDVMKRADLYQEKFDAIISIGMLEHVGEKNYETFMKAVDFCLKPGGYFLCHCIGSKKSNHIPEQWIRKYIFPNGHIPSLAQIARASEVPDAKFIIEDVQNFGACYDKTLMAWNANFQRAWMEDGHLRAKYGPRFKRMWEFYLLTCAGAFRSRSLQLFQCVISKGGPLGLYIRPSLSTHL